MKIELKQGVSKDLINKDFKNQLFISKNKIDQFYNMSKTYTINNRTRRTNKWAYYRSLLNKYEDVTSSAKQEGRISRAYYKLKELMIDDKSKYTKIKKVATLAEGPGGFIKFITDYYPSAEIYGITLKYDQDDRNMEKFLEENKKVKIIYGDKPHHNGDLYNKEIVNAFANQVGKVDLVTADGGFEAKNDNDKEAEHLRLFLAETLTAFKVLKKDGSYILKIYDIFTEGTLQMLFLLSSTFKNVEIKKPVTSRPANSERYVVCHGFKGFDTDKHVDLEGPYEKIVSMTDAEKKKFEKFVYNLALKNEDYVKQVIQNIENVINFIQINDNNTMEIMNKKKEQEMYTTVWRKVYEKKERKTKRIAKKLKKEVPVEKSKLNPTAQEFVMGGSKQWYKPL